MREGIRHRIAHRGRLAVGELRHQRQRPQRFCPNTRDGQQRRVILGLPLVGRQQDTSQPFRMQVAEPDIVMPRHRDGSHARHFAQERDRFLAGERDRAASIALGLRRHEVEDRLARLAGDRRVRV